MRSPACTYLLSTDPLACSEDGAKIQARVARQATRVPTAHTGIIKKRGRLGRTYTKNLLRAQASPLAVEKVSTPSKLPKGQPRQQMIAEIQLGVHAIL